MLDEDDYLEDDLDHDQAPVERERTSRHLLPRALVESVVGIEGIKELASREAFCVIVQVPSPDFAPPVARYIHALGDWDFHTTKTTPTRNKAPDDTGSDGVVKALSAGGRVFAVSQNPRDLLPEAVQASADRTIVLPPPSGRVVGAVIRAVTGNLPDDLSDSTVERLSFEEIASCIRQTSSAEDCVRRLTAAAGRKGSGGLDLELAPLVEELHGYGAAREWALNLIADVNAWRRGEVEFGSIDRHAVLASAPGLGKTTFARSLARSTGLPLFATSVGAWFANGAGYLDSVIKQIDQVFDEARSQSPAILLLDEIDAVPNRATMTPRAAEWWTPVVTHLLIKLDGAVSDAASNLIVLGATNHGDRLDSALTRSGRLSRVITIGPPDEDALAGIFRQHLGDDLAGADLGHIGRLAIGASGAQVVAWVKAARQKSRQSRRSLELSDLVEVIAPPEQRTAELVRRVAIHEAGHAVVGHCLNVGSVVALSVVSRGNAGGYAYINHDGRAPTRGAVERLVIERLAGRAAEEVILGEPGTGSGGTAESDLAIATRLVGMLHLSTGLGDSLIFRSDPESVASVLNINDRLAAAVEAELRSLYSQAQDIIKENQDLVHSVAEALVTKRHIGAAEFLTIIAECRAVPHG